MKRGESGIAVTFRIEAEIMNRIDSACWYREWSKSENKWIWLAGTLRAWSTDHEEFENGIGPSPAGVVEDIVTNCCKSIHVCYICFADVPPAV